jgi:two-component system, chemotaxis family, protein-glutamate methylesterase/glutaminase
VIRVFVVDDSSIVRRALARALADAEDILVCGEAASGREALPRIDAQKPDLVALDLEMPGLDGLATLRELRAQDPGVRVIMMSGPDGAPPERMLEALQRGALDFVDRARHPGTEIDEFARELMAKIRFLGERIRWGGPRPVTAPLAGMPSASQSSPPDAGAGARRRQTTVRAAAPPMPLPPGPESVKWSDYDIVCIGASAGGPPALERVLSALPEHFPLPVAVVQHMPSGFTRAFAERLARVCRVSVAEAQGGERLLPGAVLIAEGGRHLGVGQGLVARVYSEAAAKYVPSIDALMTSAAAVCGPRVVGVLLTGMGEDGAEGMAAIRAAGGLTLAESEESCVVYGMPRAAQIRGAVMHELDLGEITRLLATTGP